MEKSFFYYYYYPLFFFARETLQTADFLNMASNDLFSYTQQQLINIIEQQHGEIQSLANEKRWLQ